MLSSVSPAVGISPSSTRPLPQRRQRLDPDRRAGARSGTPRPGSGRSRGRAAAGRSRAGSRRGRTRPAARVGLVSGRQTHSPLPRHIESPSESWISSRHSSLPRRSFSPNQNMLVIGAMPSRSIGLRGKSWARDLHGRDAARRDAEAVGAGDALALEQRVGGQGGVGRARPDQPEAGEARELLRPVQARCRSASPRQEMPYWSPASVARK